ncbi:MAG: hypothetical protein M3P43_18150 [Actinomycetota bacterium]|nr:hypothetical protein [Actinomycetota bacterium]
MRCSPCRLPNSRLPTDAEYGADQQQVVVDRHRVGDLIEEGPHVFIAMAFPALVPSIGGRPVERCRPGTAESMRWRTVSARLQRNTVAELAEIQTPVVRGLVIAAPSCRMRW